MTGVFVGIFLFSAGECCREVGDMGERGSDDQEGSRCS